jgi:hypothetical protein
MPRHRKDRLPSHRAPRRADNPDRRARLTSAVNTSLAVLFDSAGDDPDAADTVPLPWSNRTMAPGSGNRHRHAGARASTHPASNQAGVLRTAARGLLATPWFAAASGFVIAASLWIYAPHAHLQFPSGSAIRAVPCYGGCSSRTSHDSSGRLATAGKGRLAEPRKPGTRAGATHRGVRDNRSAVKGLTFSYYVLPSRHGFDLMIRVVGQHAIKDWRLSFVLRGDVIRRVTGANWHRTSRDSGTASGDGQPGQWPGNGQGDGGQFGGGHQQYGLTFLVSGKGSAAGPTDCVFNGQTCTFTNGRPGPS